ncbi:MAG: hypothetical protein AAF236_09130 [Verrucomicrobiota bacterium]
MLRSGISVILLLPIFSWAQQDRSDSTSTAASEERIRLIALNFLSEDSRLLKNGDIFDLPFRKKPTDFGKLPRARFEGTTLAGRPVGPQSVSLVPSFSPEAGRAIRYQLGPQGNDSKARAEHYLHVGELNQTYCSEFSMMLDPEMTIAEKARSHDQGPNWVILRQWHQSAPESPPISLGLVQGTNNIIHTLIRFGDHKGSSSLRLRGRKTLRLGHWYHFRYKWRIAPGTDDSHLTVWFSDKRWGDELQASDLLFDYRGPIGYTLRGKPESEINEMSWVIREQQGIYQGAHRDADSFHAVSIANVQIYRVE